MGIYDVDIKRDSKIPFDEALEATSQAASDWGLDAAKVGPCFALIWRDGVASERNPTAFILALELRHHNKSQEEVQVLIYRWNMEKLGSHLAHSEIARLVRNAFKECYPEPPSCKHYLLRNTCVGGDCYRYKAGNLWKTAPVTPEGVKASGLLSLIPSLEWKAFCTLHELAKRKGRRPDSTVQFTYREIEGLGGIRHQHQWKLWKRVEALGLIEDFKPSTKQPPIPGKKQKRVVSSCRFTKRLPTVEEAQEGLKVCKELKKRNRSTKTSSNETPLMSFPESHTLPGLYCGNADEPTLVTRMNHPEETE